jgi:hypothetical protein
MNPITLRSGDWTLLSQWDLLVTDHGGRFFLLLLKSSKGRQRISDPIRTTRLGDRWLRGHVEISLGLSFSVVKVLSAHFRILSDCPPLRLSANQNTAHRASHNSAEQNQNRGCQDKVCSKGHVRDEEKDIDDEGDEGDEEGDDSENELNQQVSGRMAGCMEVRRNGQNEHKEGEQSGDRVNDQDGSDVVTDTLRHVETTGIVTQQRT